MSRQHDAARFGHILMLNWIGPELPEKKTNKKDKFRKDEYKKHN